MTTVQIRIVNNNKKIMLLSAGQSIWPFHLCITSLPPEIRMNVDYLLLAGVWLGPGKPSNISVFLQPVLDKVHHLYQEGLAISTPSGPRVLKARLLCAIFDLPAKAMALNSLQYNGKYGCANCLDHGKRVGRRQLYPPNAPHTPRCESDMLKWAEDAEANGKPIFGLKGKSVLSPYLNIAKDVPVDYMHAVLEGVSRTLLLNFWFDGQYRFHRFYLGKELKEIDKMLLRIKPPHEFRRTPRSIEKSVKYWKAAEWRAWLLCYVLPLLMHILPADYVRHLCLLVASIHILLGSEISSSDLRRAEYMLQIFYQAIPKLYPEESLTCNVHSLIHLAECVRQYGPLWTFSCFGFENMNGYLKKHCHGTRNVLPQLARNLRMRQIFSTRHSSEGDGVRGRVKHKELSIDHRKALDDYSGHCIATNVLPVFSGTN